MHLSMDNDDVNCVYGRRVFHYSFGEANASGLLTPMKIFVLDASFAGVTDPKVLVEHFRKETGATHTLVVRNTIKKVMHFHEQTGCVISTSDKKHASMSNSFREMIMKQDNFLGAICKKHRLGFDAPRLDSVALMDASKSKVLVTQLICRMLRPFDGKETAKLFLPVCLPDGTLNSLPKAYSVIKEVIEEMGIKGVSICQLVPAPKAKGEMDEECESEPCEGETDEENVESDVAVSNEDKIIQAVNTGTVSASFEKFVQKFMSFKKTHGHAPSSRAESVEERTLAATSRNRTQDMRDGKLTEMECSLMLSLGLKPATRQGVSFERLQDMLAFFDENKRWQTQKESKVVPNTKANWEVIAEDYKEEILKRDPNFLKGTKHENLATA